MKACKVIFVFLFLVSFGKLLAQAREPGEQEDFDLYHKGRKIVGGFAGGNLFNQYWSVFALGNYGEFVMNKWLVGAQGFGQVGNGLRAFSAGPFTSYYFLNRPFTPVAEVNLQYYNEHNTNFYETRTTGFYSQALLGASYVGLFNGVGVTFMFNYNLLYDLKIKDVATGEVLQLEKPQTIGTAFRINYFF